MCINLKKGKRLFGIIVLLVIVSSACSKRDINDVDISETNISSMELIKTTVAYDDLINLLEDNPSIEQLNSRIALTCVKERENYYYTVFKTDQGWRIIYFDHEQNFSNEQPINISYGVSKQDMDRLKEGMSLDEVKQVDPNGDYSFIYVSWTEYPSVSYHYLEDGNVYVISYDDDYCITNINNFLL